MENKKNATTEQKYNFNRSTYTTITLHADIRQVVCERQRAGVRGGGGVGYAVRKFQHFAGRLEEKSVIKVSISSRKYQSDTMLTFGLDITDIYDPSDHPCPSDPSDPSDGSFLYSGSALVLNK